MTTPDTLAARAQAGRYARQAGRGIDTCPLFGITPEARLEVRAWQEGWMEEDRKHPRPQSRKKP